MTCRVIRLAEAARKKGRHGVRAEELAQDLEFAIDSLMTSTINLAMARAWAEWDAKQPIGTVQDISLKALSETSDPTVRRMALLLKEASDILTDLRTPSRNRPA